jgi:hypothetical protein
MYADADDTPEVRKSVRTKNKEKY